MYKDENIHANVQRLNIFQIYSFRESSFDFYHFSIIFANLTNFTMPS